jgi:hypothetical protein
MNSLCKAIAVVTFGCLVSQMCGCVASSNLVDKWQDPSFNAPPLGKMLVIAVRKDATKRRIWEDAFAVELAKHSVAAISSYSLYPDAPPDTNQVIAAVQTNGFDGILVILRLQMETDKQYIQGYTTQIQDVRYSPYWNRYWTFYRDVVHPGYVDSQKVAMSAIDVTTTGNGGRLIWSATSRTPDPGSVPDLQRGIAGLVIFELAQRKIISAEK